MPLNDTERIPATAEEIAEMKRNHVDDGKGNCQWCSDEPDDEFGSQADWPCDAIRAVWAWDVLRGQIITITGGRRWGKTGEPEDSSSEF